MNPWYAKGAMLLATLVMVAIRAPHGQRSRGIKVVSNRRGALEIALLVCAGLGSILPLLWIVTPLLSFADYPLHPALLAAGVVCFTAGLWLFYRSHADLGVNWSITLEVREKHQLVTAGIYRHVRHPMYLALVLYSLGQALVVPNWLAGPSSLVAFGLLFALRVVPEERMMLEVFGDEYRSYMSRTKRLIPGLW